MNRNWVHHERDGEYIEKPGRKIRWVQTTENTGSVYSEVCTCVYAPGGKSKPAHAHPEGEETVYVIAGSGKVKIGDRIYDFEPGSVIFFPQGLPHMVWNTGAEDVHFVCFYAPGERARSYAWYGEEFDFPGA